MPSFFQRLMDDHGGCVRRHPPGTSVVSGRRSTKNVEFLLQQVVGGPRAQEQLGLG